MSKFFIYVFSFIILLSGCANLKEAARGFAGVSTKILEDNRKTAVAKTVASDYFTAYNKALGALKEIGAYVYAQGIKEHLIAIYVSSTDTTPVGIFFKEVDANNTRLEVSSPSSYARDLIAEKLFAELGK